MSLKQLVAKGVSYLARITKVAETITAEPAPVPSDDHADYQGTDIGVTAENI